MKIIPAIDLRKGACVRLYKGDFDTAEQVADGAVSAAAAFKEAGAELIHMVDLDAVTGKGVRRNSGIIADVISETGLKVEAGGGIRSMSDMEELDGLGVYRFIIGSALIPEPELIGEAVERFGADRVAAGIDCRNGLVHVSGWYEGTGVPGNELAKKLYRYGARIVIYTDIDKDGTLEGPPLLRLRRLREYLPADMKIIASGGVGSLEDVKALKEFGMDGVIIGKAVYTGDVDLKAAIELAGER